MTATTGKEIIFRSWLSFSLSFIYFFTFPQHTGTLLRKGIGILTAGRQHLFYKCTVTGPQRSFLLFFRKSQNWNCSGYANSL